MTFDTQPPRAVNTQYVAIDPNVAIVKEIDPNVEIILSELAKAETTVQEVNRLLADYCTATNLNLIIHNSNFLLKMVEA
jgi:hypothetical protein